MSSSTSLKDWVTNKNVKKRLDTAIKASARDLRDRCSAEQFLAAHANVGNLKNGSSGTCDYELPGVAAAYLLQWQGKRIHDGLQVLSQLPDVLSADRIIDWGAGTGASLAAAALFRQYRYDIGQKFAHAALLPAEPTREMADGLRSFWPRFIEQFPEVAAHTSAPMISDEIRTVASAKVKRTSLIASYPFATDGEPSTAKAIQDFPFYVDRFDVSAVLVWTAQTKSLSIESIRSILTERGWLTVSLGSQQTSGLRGPLAECQKQYMHHALRHGLTIDEEITSRIHWGGAATAASVLAMASSKAVP